MEEYDEETQPVGALENRSDAPDDPDVPERLKKVLEALSTYHEQLLQQFSLQTQNPDALRGIEAFLADKAKILRYFILHGSIPNGLSPDPQLQKCLTTLQKNLDSWNPKINTLANYWCNTMFVQYPFTINHKHINQLLENSFAKVDDGPSEQE